MMPITGIIAARGGSTRIPRKNVMPFCGRPLIAWTIIQTRAVPGIGEIYLTTDDDGIADVGREYGITIHMREDPHESADTTTGAIPVYNVIQKYNLIDHAIVPFLATSPLRQQKDIDAMLEVFYKYDEKYQVIGLIPRDSIVMSRLIENDEVRPFFTYERNRYDVDENDFGFLDHIGTFISIAPARHYDYEINRMNKSKDWTGEIHWDHMARERRKNLKCFPMEEWQRYDIDCPEDVEMAEYFFVKKGLQEYWNKRWEEMQ